MLPACRTASEGFAIPTFDVVPSDVEGFMEELWEFQATFHDCFARSESRVHFFDYMVGQFSKLERKSIEPMALLVVAYLLLADIVSRPLPCRLNDMNQPVISKSNQFSTPR